MTEIRPAGREVELFNDHCFRLLRQKAQLSDGFINEGWSMASLAGGGGKGGTLMAKVGNFIVKELSAGDHKTLLQVTDSFGEHLRAGPSLLSPIFLHFRDKETKRCFFAMRNCVGKGPFQALYDLKGCADDKLLEKDGIPVTAVHKRIWNVPMWCSCTWSQDRRRYYEGKLEARQVDIPLPAEQREAFLLALRRDVSWLAGQNLMDYSLLVAIKEIKEEPSQGLPPGQPYIHETPLGF
ncbi:unnamed protein product [Effrenium voratum]|nr:unnamed protein product [Effrenium voratum]